MGIAIGEDFKITFLSGISLLSNKWLIMDMQS
jgi:hypothetical protein